MKGNKAGAIAVKMATLVVVIGAVWPAVAQDAKTPYPTMAPVDQYGIRTSCFSFHKPTLRHGEQICLLLPLSRSTTPGST